MSNHISAKIVADSLNVKTGNRITSFVLVYHRYILAELNTHRAFSRNTSSSRAIPVSKMIEQVKTTPAIPIHWGKNQKGMQASEELTPEQQEQARLLWLEAAENAVNSAQKMTELGLHKQVANRVLEPFQYVTTLLTATEFGNFYNLRVHPDAQPEIDCLSRKMAEAQAASVPKRLQPGEWHMPFCDTLMQDAPEDLATRLKIATARAARVSYRNFEGTIDFTKDTELHDSLKASGHMSPFEHSARAMGNGWVSGNFVGWEQYRKTIPNENRGTFDFSSITKN